MKKNYVITAALPYVNNKIHLGHIFSTFLPSDLHARTLRLFDRRVVFISGSDVFGSQMLVEAIKNKTDIKSLSDLYIKEHRESLKYLDISFTRFLSTDIQEHAEKVNMITDYLIEKNEIYKDTEKFLFCKIHNIYLVDYAKTEKDTCVLCISNKPNLEVREHYVLKLKTKKANFERLIKSSLLNETAQNEIKKILTDQKIEVFGNKTITRPFDYGVKIDQKHEVEGVFYVWYEALISYMSFTDQWNKAEERIQYMGKDNVFFHTVLLSNIYVQNRNPEKIFAGSFLLDKGEKFSKSQRKGIFCSEIKKQRIESDAVRFALSFLYREKDINISLDEIKKIINNVLIGKVLNTFQRFFNLANKLNIVIFREKITANIAYKYSDQILVFFDLIHNKQDLTSSMNLFISMIDSINKTMEEQQIWKTVIEEDLSNIYFSLAVASKILSIYCPKVGNKIEKIIFNDDFNIESIYDKKVAYYSIYKNMKKYLKISKSTLMMKKIETEDNIN